MSETALTKPASNSILQRARAQVASPRFDSYPVMKMVNTGSSAKDMQMGQFYVERSVEEDEKRKKVQESIGVAPEVIILKRRYSYSWFDEKADNGQGRLMAWTNELDGFGPDQVVHLMTNLPDEGKKVRTMPFHEFRNWKQGDLAIGQRLTFKNVLYVLHGEPRADHVYKLFVSNASVTGVKDGEKTGDYKNPEPGSLTAFEKMLSWNGIAFLERNCRLGSRKKTGGMEFYLMTFTDVGDNPVLDQSAMLFDALEKDLALRYHAEFGGGQAQTEVPGMIDVPAIEYQSPVKTEDLPF